MKRTRRDPDDVLELTEILERRRRLRRLRKVDPAALGDAVAGLRGTARVLEDWAEEAPERVAALTVPLDEMAALLEG